MNTNISSPMIAIKLDLYLKKKYIKLIKTFNFKILKLKILFASQILQKIIIHFQK